MLGLKSWNCWMFCTERSLCTAPEFSLRCLLAAAPSCALPCDEADDDDDADDDGDADEDDDGDDDEDDDDATCRPASASTVTLSSLISAAIVFSSGFCFWRAYCGGSCSRHAVASKRHRSSAEAGEDEAEAAEDADDAEEAEAAEKAAAEKEKGAAVGAVSARVLASVALRRMYSSTCGRRCESTTYMPPPPEPLTLPMLVETDGLHSATEHARCQFVACKRCGVMPAARTAKQE